MRQNVKPTEGEIQPILGKQKAEGFSPVGRMNAEEGTEETGFGETLHERKNI
jgi:hypothetical protein